ncbi:hypothetical protein [Rheinheimera baltica]|uniref:hypothetical protein n=1 Tax=Rheinheimera baltica TaxID=67576 RepID=UPI0004899CAE|nr:hypothetical protein [Rheinheimera baltica]
MEGSVLAAALFGLFCGIPFMVMGYLIGVKQKRNLLASWDDSSYSDPVLVGKIMGASVFIMGLLIFASCVGVITNLLSMIHAGVILCLSAVTPLLAALYVNVMHEQVK